MRRNVTRPDTIAVPAEYGTSPIFVPEPPQEPRSVTFPDGIIWTIGVMPFSGIQTLCRKKGFDVRHAQVLFGLLSYYHTNSIANGKNINLSWRELARVCGLQHGTPQQELLKEVLDDLRTTWTRIEYPNGDQDIFVVLLGYNSQIRNGKPSLGYVVFDDTFMSFLLRIEKYIGFRFDVWSEMTSRLAKAIYLYIPSRAIYHTDTEPFRITLTNLYTQLDIDIPRHKSLRYKYFTQNKRSVLAQLNNAPIHGDKILKVKLEETGNGKDYSLCAWVEKGEIGTEYFTIGVHPESKLLAWWQCGGKDIDSFKKRVKQRDNLNPYEKEKLTGAGLNIGKDMAFLEMSKSLLGAEPFAEICGELNMRSQSGTVKNPGAYLTALIRETLSKEVYQPLLQLTSP